MRWWWSIVGLVGCATGGAPGSLGGPACDAGATYPEGSVEPMAVGGVLTPYRWPVAVDRATGARLPLDLALAPCDLDPDLDWSPHEALLFVSIPAW